MRTTKSLSVGAAVAMFALAVGMTGVARADVSTERPGSILIFPKVVNTTDQDTIIQITNTQTTTTHARCFYIDGADGRWQETDFEIWLTRLQPTHWLASAGRRIDPLDSDTGFDPGAVPRVASGFTGELLCATVDDSDVPIAKNSLIGQATVKNINPTANQGDVSKYNAISVHGNTPMSGNTLMLDNTEYNGCPAALNFTTLATQADDPAIDSLGSSPSSVTNFITLIPCSADLENLVGSTVGIGVVAYNEFEQRISGSAPVTEVNCWTRVPLASIGPFSIAQGASQFVFGTVTPLSSDGVLAVLDSVVTDGVANSASAANNVHFVGNTETTNLPVTSGGPAVIRLSAP